MVESTDNHQYANNDGQYINPSGEGLVSMISDDT